MLKKLVIFFILVGINFNIFADDSYINAVWYNVYQINLSSQMDAKAQIDEHFRMFKDIKVNKVFFLVKNPNGRAYYKSSILKPVLVTDFVTGKNEELKWDTLEYIIKKGKEYNIKICPYVNIFAEEGYYLEENPGFAERNKEGKVTKWVSPTVPVVKERMQKILEEIVSNYDIDGIQFDRVRYENINSGYNEKSLELFKLRYGRIPANDKDLSFIEFRKESVNEFVSDLYQTIKKIKPDLEVSAAVFHSPTTALEVLQDWGKWVENDNIDAIYTMTYTNDNLRFKTYLNENIEVLKKNNGKVKIVIGMGPYYKNMTTDILKKQLQMCFEKNELSGVCWFSAYNLMEDRFYNVMKNVDYNNKKIN